MSEPHDVVKLLAARMESHPEEFPVNPNGQLPIMGRWAPWLAQAEHLMDDAERTLLYAKAKEAIFQRIHEEVLDELMNGPERRRKEAEERESIMQSALAKQQQTQRNLQQFYDADLDRYQNAGVTHIAGEGPYLKAVGTTGTISVASQPELSLSSSTINAIKKALNL
jgi:hypothetical protein